MKANSRRLWFNQDVCVRATLWAWGFVQKRKTCGSTCWQKNKSSQRNFICILVVNLEHFIGTVYSLPPSILPLSSNLSTSISISVTHFLHFPGSFLRASKESACTSCCHLWVIRVGGQELSRNPSCLLLELHWILVYILLLWGQKSAALPLLQWIFLCRESWMALQQSSFTKNSSLMLKCG